MSLKFANLAFFNFFSPSGGQKFDVSKVCFHGCLKLSLNLTKRYKVKRLKIMSFMVKNVSNTAFEAEFQKRSWKRTFLGFFSQLRQKFQVFYAWNLLVRLRESFRHP